MLHFSSVTRIESEGKTRQKEKSFFFPIWTFFLSWDNIILCVWCEELVEHKVWVNQMDYKMMMEHRSEISRSSSPPTRHAMIRKRSTPSTREMCVSTGKERSHHIELNHNDNACHVCKFNKTHRFFSWVSWETWWKMWRGLRVIAASLWIICRSNSLSTRIISTTMFFN